jgi:hypothetical protein
MRNNYDVADDRLWGFSTQRSMALMTTGSSGIGVVKGVEEAVNCQIRRVR